MSTSLHPAPLFFSCKWNSIRHSKMVDGPIHRRKIYLFFFSQLDSEFKKTNKQIDPYFLSFAYVTNFLLTSQWNRHTHFYTICGRIPFVYYVESPHPFCSHLIRKLLPLFSWCHFNGWTFFSNFAAFFYIHRNLKNDHFHISSIQPFFFDT